jgi:chromosome partitioning protein
MEIIAIVNRRGGAGKTATAHAIGAGLHHRGHRILYIDLDSQGNLSYDTGADSEAYTSMDVLTGRATARQAIQHTETGDIIPGGQDLATADNILTGTGKEYRLREAIEPLESEYDYIVIDTPPALGTLTINALTACNSVIIPAQAEIHSIQGIGLLNDAIQAVKRYTNKKIKIKGILITRYSGRAILSRQMKEGLEETARQLKTAVFPVPVRECIAIKEAQATRKDIFTYAPRSNGAKDYTALIDAIEREK